MGVESHPLLHKIIFPFVKAQYSDHHNNAIHYLTPGKLAEAGRDFLKETPDDSMHLLLLWITFLCELREKAIHSKFLAHILRERPKGGGFATLYFLNQILQTKFADYCDIVKTSLSTKLVHNAIHSWETITIARQK